MTHEPSMAPASAAYAVPEIRKITIADLIDALENGARDFKREPTHVLFVAVLYPIVGLVLCRAAFGYKVLPLLFPLAAGFALIGPVAAIGFYEISRRRELGLSTSWLNVFNVFRAPSAGAIVTLGGLLLIIFLAWLYTAEALYEGRFGTPPASLTEFINQLFNTPDGHFVIVAGNAIGFLFAALIFCISVVSFPMLVDRNVGAATAMATSVKAVAANPVTMAVWAFIIAALLVIGSLPLFVGLAVVLPILGHASWHLYRRVVIR